MPHIRQYAASSQQSVRQTVLRVVQKRRSRKQGIAKGEVTEQASVAGRRILTANQSKRARCWLEFLTLSQIPKQRGTPPVKLQRLSTSDPLMRSSQRITRTW